MLQLATVISLFVLSLYIISATQYTVYVGQSSVDSNLQGEPSYNFMKFYPNNLTTHTSDIIQFQFTPTEPHSVSWFTGNTISFLNPVLFTPYPQYTPDVIFNGSNIFNSGSVDYDTYELVCYNS